MFKVGQKVRLISDKDLPITGLKIGDICTVERAICGYGTYLYAGNIIIEWEYKIGLMYFSTLGHAFEIVPNFKLRRKK